MPERKTDIIYFLGAGFSALFGIPTMKKMVDGFEEEMRLDRLDEIEKQSKMLGYPIWLREERMDTGLEALDKNLLKGRGMFGIEPTYKVLDPYQKEREKIEKEKREIIEKLPFKGLLTVWSDLKEDGPLDIETIISRMNTDYYLSLYKDLIRDPAVWMAITKLYFEIDIGFPIAAIIENNNMELKPKLNELRSTVERRFSALRKILFDYIRRVCSSELNREEIVKKLKRLLVQFKNFNIDLFTTNYDFVIENWLQGMGIPFELGIELDPRDRITYWDFIKIAECDSRVRLIKLHGSIDLYTTSDERIISSPIIASNGSLADGRSYKEMMIYPTQQKTAEDYPFKQMFAELSKAISQAKVLVFIGFNFNYNDKHISEAVEKGIANNRQLKKVVVVKGHPENSVKELLKIKGLGRKRIKAIAGRMPKREVASEIVTTIREALG